LANSFRKSRLRIKADADGGAALREREKVSRDHWSIGIGLNGWTRHQASPQ
jgi:hypothetical protein